MGWYLGIGALCVAVGLLILAMYVRRRREDRRPRFIPGVGITGFETTEQWAEAERAAAAAADWEPVLPPLKELDYELALRLGGRVEFDELQQLFGGYFHQDWYDEFDDDEDAIRGYLKGHAHLPEHVDELRKQMDALLALGLSDQEMREALDVLGSEYIPNEATAWVRSVRAKVG